MQCYQHIEVTKLQLRHADDTNYIDLFEEFKLYQQSLNNSLVKEVEYVSSIGAGYAYDTENYIQQALTLTGTIRAYDERQILSFLSKVNQRYILEVTKDGIDYIRFVKIPSIANEYRNRGSINNVTVDLIPETAWLKAGSFPMQSNNLPIGSADYGNGEYSTNNYTGANIGESAGIKLLTLSSDFRVHWSITGITNGTPLIINLNGDIITQKSSISIPSGSLFEYTNIPFYNKLNLDGSPFVQNMDLNNPVFEVYFQPTEQNFFIVEGLDDAVITYYESYGVI